MEKLKVDFTGSDRAKCLRKYYLAGQGWETLNGSTALRFGGAFHAGMEGFYSHIAEEGWKNDGKAVERMLVYAKNDWDKRTGENTFFSDYRTFENLSILLTSYLNFFYQDEGFLEVLHTERAFKLLMKPSEEDIRHFPWLKEFYFTGKIDSEIQLNGMNWINEFKTTGWRMDEIKKKLNRSAQIMGYNYASKKVYENSPEGNFVTIAFGTSRKSPKTGNYGKFSVDFARVPQIYNDIDLEDWRRHFIRAAARIQYAYDTDYFPPNFAHCYDYGRCEYLNICEQSRPFQEASMHGYVQKEPWDVTTEVPGSAVMEGEE